MTTSAPTDRRADLDWLREGMRFTNRWRLPLIFVVSGAAVMLALGRRSGGAFVLVS